MISFHENGLPFIIVRMGRGGRQEHRPAIACTVPGRTLLGNLVRFPGHRPETATFERATWTRTGWIVSLRPGSRKGAQ